MNRLEQRKLQMLRDKYGNSFTSDEALMAALNAEQIKNDCGIADQAWKHFACEQLALETMALLLEKENLVSV